MGWEVLGIGDRRWRFHRGGAEVAEGRSGFQGRGWGLWSDRRHFPTASNRMNGTCGIERAARRIRRPFRTR
jgi:hypothetical protein